MKVSTSFFTGYAVKDWEELTEFALALERVGVAGLWSPEAWGHDGATPLGYLAAKTSTLELGTSILQVGARTPANLAMTAMSLYSMSGGRFKLGIGTSGPQVMEGWHGVVFDRPVQRTRETIEIVRRIFRQYVHEGMVGLAIARQLAQDNAPTWRPGSLVAQRVRLCSSGEGGLQGHLVVRQGTLGCD